MAYMIFQQYTTAIKTAYEFNPLVHQHAAQAKACRLWLAGLDIDETVRDTLVEQMRAVEQAFDDLCRQQSFITQTT